MAAVATSATASVAATVGASVLAGGMVAASFAGGYGLGTSWQKVNTGLDPHNGAPLSVDELDFEAGGLLGTAAGAFMPGPKQRRCPLNTSKTTGYTLIEGEAVVGFVGPSGKPIFRDISVGHGAAALEFGLVSPLAPTTLPKGYGAFTAAKEGGVVGFYGSGIFGPMSPATRAAVSTFFK